MTEQTPDKPDSPPARASAAAKRGRKGPAGLRKWLYRLLAVVLGPVVAMLLLEGGLRIAGYGQSHELFTAMDSESALTTHATWGGKFFPPSMLREPLPVRMARPKPAGTYRIVVLGGSAAKGVPEPAYSFSHQLEVMLEDAYPQAAFEVVNTALTAINSHVVLPIAREAATHEPDLFIIYMGNNEVVGPYGAGTVLSEFTGSLGAIRFGLWVRGTRTGQLLGALVRSITGKRDELRVWRGMEMFREQIVTADDPRLIDVYAHFRANLRDIIAAGQEAGADVIACTVASNLRDNPPFASELRGPAQHDRAKREAWDAAYEAGVGHEDAVNFAEAIDAYREALDLDDTHAGLHYRLARSLLREGEGDAALDHFVKARDLDALRFRADTRINEIITEVASASSVTLIDTVKLFGERSVEYANVPGREWFYEHVHLTFAGNHAIAAALFDEVAARLPASIASGTGAAAAPADLERCRALLAFTPWGEYKLVSSITALIERPPFTDQIDHETDLAARRADVAQLRAALDDETLLAADGTFKAAVDRRPDDPLLRAQYAAFLHEVGYPQESADHYRQLLSRWPDRSAWRSALGRALADAGQVDAAISELQQVMDESPYAADAPFNLGVALMRAQRAQAARESFEAALELDSKYVEAMHQLALLALGQNQPSQATPWLERALEEDESFAPSRNTLAIVHLRQGRIDEAITQVKRLLEIDPTVTQAAMEVAGTLTTHPNQLQRRPDVALEILQAIDPNALARDPRLLDLTSIVHASLGNLEEAIDFAQRAEDVARAQGNVQAAETIAARRRQLEQQLQRSTGGS